MNNKLMFNIILLLVIGSFIGASGQLILKIGLQQIGNINLSVAELPHIIFRIFTNMFVLLGLSISFFAAIFWILSLSKINLSSGYIIGSGLFYVFVITLSIIFLKEKINLMQIFGICITFLGVIILAKS
jgi:multidrug transporter EmrE-like cation transporter